MSCKNCPDPGGYTTATGGQIIEAWTKASKAKKADVTLANKRLGICSTCDENHQTSGVLAVLTKVMPQKLKDRHSEFYDRQCQICHCPLTTKVYVEVGEEGQGDCPLGKWDSKPEADAATEVN